MTLPHNPLRDHTHPSPILELACTAASFIIIITLALVTAALLGAGLALLSHLIV